MDTATIMERAAQRKLTASVKPWHMEEFFYRDIQLACLNVLKEIKERDARGCKREHLTHLLHSPATVDWAIEELGINGAIHGGPDTGYFIYDRSVVAWFRASYTSDKPMIRPNLRTPRA